VLTGFLGSGKTTLLRRILADPAYAGTAVLINEVGEVGLDHLLLGQVEGEPVLLESGCICCTIRGDLAAALRGLLERRRSGTLAFDRVVVETSGLSDPTPVMATLLGDLAVRRGLRQGRVLATLDAVHAPAGLDAQPLLRKQAAVADVLLVTKADLAGDAGANALMARLRALNPAAEIARATHGAVARGVLDGDGGARDWTALAAAAVAHDATSFTVVLDAPVEYGAFALWFSLLVHRHGARLPRVKAILDVAGSDRPVLLHAVQHVIHSPEHLPAWPGERRSAIVFVTDGLARAAVARSLMTFLRG
jgi:G3E family GTPase